MSVTIHYPTNPATFEELLSEGIAELLCGVDLPSDSEDETSDKESAA